MLFRDGLYALVFLQKLCKNCPHPETLYSRKKNSNIQIEICTTGNTKINGALVRELFPSKKTKVAKFFHHWFICFLLDELTNDASLTFNYWTQHLTNLTYISFCIKCHLKWGKLFFALGEVTRLKFLK